MSFWHRLTFNLTLSLDSRESMPVKDLETSTILNLTAPNLKLNEEPPPTIFNFRAKYPAVAKPSPGKMSSSK